MDAGIATEDNLKIIRSPKYNYDYVCVSRTVPKEFTKLSAKAKVVYDNRNNEIELTKSSVQGTDDCFLHIKSSQKEKKEVSIDDKLTLRLEAQLQDIKVKLPRKGTLKKTEKVHEKVGRIKAKLSKIGWLYDITYTEDKEKGIVTDINWHRVKERERPKGEYFLRYTNTAISESEIWNIYNMTRDVEAVFRCLKTDLRIRPIHHQKDKYIEPHIWLGILAYQIVNYIKRELKEDKIDYSWTTIVEKMKSMQTSMVSVNNTKGEKIYMKLCTRPTTDQKSIFDSLNFKHRPYVRKTKVVPQLQKIKSAKPCTTILYKSLFASWVKADKWTGYAPIKKDYPGLTQVLSNKGKNFAMLHIQIRNFKNWLRGVHSYCNKEYLQRYIDEYFFRFNRRNHRETILDRLIDRCVQHEPATYAQIKLIAN